MLFMRRLGRLGRRWITRPYNRPGDENDAEARDRQTGPIQAAQGCHI